MTATTADRELLREYLASSHRIAGRLAWSLSRIRHPMPLDAEGIDALTQEDEERFDALLFRFNSLTAMIQDHLARAILKLEEEDVRDRSRRDQRLLLEKLGAFGPGLDFGSLAELRNRIAHHYPDDPEKQAEILTSVGAKSHELIRAYDDMLRYCDAKHFGGALGMVPVCEQGS